MSLSSLEAFLERALEEPELRRSLANAPDAAAVAAIARAAGYPVSELDLWQATAATPDEQPTPAQSLPTRARPTDRTTGLHGPDGESRPAAARPGDTSPTMPSPAALAPPGVLPDPWFPEEPLNAFVHQAQGDAELQQALATASDAAAVASIAQAAGYPIREVDLWLASGTTPDELAASLRPPAAEGSRWVDPQGVASPPGGGGPAGESLWGEGGFSQLARFAEEEGLAAEESCSGERGWVAAQSFSDAEGLSGEGVAAAGDGSDVEIPVVIDDPLETSRRTGSGVPGAEAAFSGEAPFASDDDLPVDQTFAAEGFQAGEEERGVRASAEEAIHQLLRQAQTDADLREALAAAPDVSTVAAIAQAAGHPINELALWLASGAAFEEARPEPELDREPPTPEADPLTLFLRAVEADPDLQTVLASAPDAATVAALARIAGFPLTSADLWAASDAVPHELVLVEEVVFLD